MVFYFYCIVSFWYCVSNTFITCGSFLFSCTIIVLNTIINSDIVSSTLYCMSVCMSAAVLGSMMKYCIMSLMLWCSSVLLCCVCLTAHIIVYYTILHHYNSMTVSLQCCNYVIHIYHCDCISVSLQVHDILSA